MRKLATVRKISKITPIQGADNIEVAQVDDWQVVVKKGEFLEGELAVYFEIDSWIPHSIAPFLTKTGRFPKTYEGVKGEHLRTVKLRGQISQGLLLPLTIISNADPSAYYGEETDVSETLGIVKYETPTSAQLAGFAKGNFPALVRKTDQERVQNLSKYWKEYTGEGLDITYEVTEKLEGSSCTFYLSDEGGFEVCSRNLSLKEDENNAYWKVAKSYNVEQKMRGGMYHGFAIQGELIGPGIQGNIYNLKNLAFYVYDIFDTKTQRYLAPEDCRDIAEELELKHVPVISTSMSLTYTGIKDVLEYAEGQSCLNTVEREGVVFKCNQNKNSFKAISNKYLLKSKN